LQRKNNRTQRSKVDIGLQELLFIHTAQFSHCTVRLKPNCAEDYETLAATHKEHGEKEKRSRDLCLFDSLLLLLLLLDGSALLTEVIVDSWGCL
jgi:hypothetical protein